jgi:DNA-binding transcriptional MerR regulator
MNIKQFSILTNISPHTLRYYEKMGLLKQIERNTSGHRNFTQKDVVWVEFIKRLKETGMPLKQILEKHAVLLEEKIAEEQSHLQMLRQKIQYYRTIID